MKKRIARVNNAYPNSGVGSRASELVKHMPATTDFEFEDILLDGVTRTLYVQNNITRAVPQWPAQLGSKSITWIRLGRLLTTYDGYDITNQTLSFIGRTRQPSIVTVHDIIELTHPQSKKAAFLNRYLLSGIPKASHIVTVSEFTKQAVQEYFNYPEHNISVIPNGVSEAFHPADEKNREEQGPVILFVGSEHPRKNFPVALQVVANLKKEFPTITLIKVGAPGLAEGREKTMESIQALRLEHTVHLKEEVTEEDLISLYQRADVLISPSTLEGFGMTPLQAMACGCPVVCSNTTSLPEVVGDAALTCNPNDAEVFTEHVRSILRNPDLAIELSQKGIAQAKKFSWDDAGSKLLEVYKKTFL